MKKAPFLILILLTSCLQVIPISQGATDEGYGEDQTALGQFVDSFENYNNITVIEDLIVNVTLECVELNYTIGGFPVLENYSTYIENDANNRFAVTDNIIVIEALSRADLHHYITYDYGVNYFTDFTHDFDARGRDTSGGSGNDIMYVWALANVVDDPVDMIANNDEFIAIMFYEFDTSDPGQPDIQLQEIVNGVTFADLFQPAARDTWYYFRIVKSGISLVCGIYSTSNLRNAGDGTDGDIDNLSLTLHLDHNFRYIYAVSSYGSGHANREMSGDIHNLYIGRISVGGYDPDGYFLTDDYLNDTVCNGTTLGLMVNSTIPYNTDIQVQFSNDNATWGDWEGIPLDSNILTGGFETIDLRYLNYTDIYFMFNLSTTDGSITPRLFQARLISTIGNLTVCPPAGPSGGGGIGFMMLILICTPIIILLVWRTRKR